MLFLLNIIKFAKTKYVNRENVTRHLEMPVFDFWLHQIRCSKIIMSTTVCYFSGATIAKKRQCQRGMDNPDSRLAFHWLRIKCFAAKLNSANNIIFSFVYLQTHNTNCFRLFAQNRDKMLFIGVERGVPCQICTPAFDGTPPFFCHFLLILWK